MKTTKTPITQFFYPIFFMDINMNSYYTDRHPSKSFPQTDFWAPCGCFLVKMTVRSYIDKSAIQATKFIQLMHKLCVSILSVFTQSLQIIDIHTLVNVSVKTAPDTAPLHLISAINS